QSTQMVRRAGPAPRTVPGGAPRLHRRRGVLPAADLPLADVGGLPRDRLARGGGAPPPAEPSSRRARGHAPGAQPGAGGGMRRSSMDTSSGQSAANGGSTSRGGVTYGSVPVS